MKDFFLLNEFLNLCGTGWVNAQTPNLLLQRNKKSFKWSISEGEEREKRMKLISGWYGNIWSSHLRTKKYNNDEDLKTVPNYKAEMLHFFRRHAWMWSRDWCICSSTWWGGTFYHKNIGLVSITQPDLGFALYGNSEPPTVISSHSLKLYSKQTALFIWTITL